MHDSIVSVCDCCRLQTTVPMQQGTTSLPTLTPTTTSICPVRARRPPWGVGLVAQPHPQHHPCLPPRPTNSQRLLPPQVKFKQVKNSHCFRALSTFNLSHACFIGWYQSSIRTFISIIESIICVDGVPLLSC